MTKKPKSIPSPQRIKPLTVRLPDDLRAIIENAAARDRRSISFVVVAVLKEWADIERSGKR
jgi:uncharacterized protein (DUF1778 family)